MSTHYENFYLFLLGGVVSLNGSAWAGDQVEIPVEVEKPQYEWSKFALGIAYVY